MVESVDDLNREDIASMLLSGDCTDNIVAVSAAIHHGFFDAEISELVGKFAESDAPVPFDRTLGDLCRDYFDLVKAKMQIEQYSRVI